MRALLALTVIVLAVWFPASAGADFGTDGFLSPDHKTWCSGDAREVGCVTSPAHGKALGAIVKRGGKTILCPEGSAGPGWACFQNFDDTAPVLHYGQSAEVGRFRCTSRRRGVTCVVRRSGRGFRIGGDEVVSVRGAG